jgi:hypothetical protein
MSPLPDRPASLVFNIRILTKPRKRLSPSRLLIREPSLMNKMILAAVLAFAPTEAAPLLAQESSTPAWIQRGAKGAAQAAMAPLIGSWDVELSIYGTMGRSPNEPPIVARGLRATRGWIADGHYLEETIEGSVAGQPYWRRGWLGYSNIDRRYEWVTVAPLVPMMFYQGKPGSGPGMPLDLSGTFTDQGVVGERSVGQTILQQTLLRIEGPDRHVSELYFTPPGRKRQLAMRIVFMRAK